MADNDDRDCPTHLLADTPASADILGGHERIAAALAETIRTPHDGSHVAALRGPVGSGKSTVIRLLDGQMKPNERMFVFDTWLHETEPLRRAFLESLLDRLQEARWLRARDAARLRRLIDLRKDRSSATVETRLTTAGRVSAGLAVIVAIGAVFLGKTDVGITFPGGWTVALWKLGLVCTLGLPGAVAAFVVLRNVWRGRAAFQDVNFTAQTTSSTTASETRRGPERGLREFLRVFGTAIRKALRDPERRLVIVLDNLDRVDPERVSEVWTTISAFLEAPRALRKREVAERVWFIVPFDPKTNGTPLEDKLFDASFDVRDPVLMNWSRYFLEQLRKAFPRHGSDPQHGDVYRLFAVTREEETPITPRDINRFINAVGALHRQWHGRMPLLHMALFVAVPDLIQRRPLQIRKDRPSAEVLRIVGPPEEWQKNVFGLFFNVDPSEAEHAALSGDILKALISGGVEELRRLRDVRGFDRVLNDVVAANAAEWKKSAPQVLAVAASTLAGLGDRDAHEDAWRVLARAVRGWTEWPLGEEGARGAAAILFHARSDAILQDVVETYRRGATKDIAAWYAGWELLREFWPDRFVPMELKATPLFFVQLLRVAIARETAKHFALNAKPEELVSLFEVLLEEADYATYLPVLQQLVALHPDWPWQRLVDACLKIVGESTGRSALAAFATLAHLTWVLPLDRLEPMKEWFVNGNAVRVFLNDPSSKAPMIALLARMLVWHGELPERPSAGLAVDYLMGRNNFEETWNKPDDRPGYVQDVAEAIRELDLEFLLDTSDPSPFVAAVRKAIMQTGVSGKN